MPEYKLTYFAIRGRAEPIRYVFAQAGVPFTDERIPHDKWPELKASMVTPFGQLPVLSIDGKVLAQSMTIARYVAREYGLVGKNSFEQAQADMYVDGISDVFPAMHAAYGAAMAKDTAKAKEEFAKFKESTLLGWLDRYEKFLTENGTGWLVGDNVTWADLLVACFLNMLEDGFDPDALSKHPKMKEHVRKVHALPNVKKYVDSRPPVPI